MFQKSSYEIFCLELLKNGIEKYIKNVKAKFALLEINSTLIPITITDTSYDSSYICSPYTAIISYPSDDIKKNQNTLTSYVIISLLNFMGSILKMAQINKTIQINNYLSSTNLYYGTKNLDCTKIKNFLIKEFSNHTQCYRSLNLNQLITLINKAAFVISNDTGPAHICTHLNKKGLVLFGSHTSPEKVSIESENFKSITSRNLSELKNRLRSRKKGTTEPLEPNTFP